MTTAISGVHNALQRRTKSKMTHMWADGLHHPCRLGHPKNSTGGNKITKGLHVGRLAMPPLPPGGSRTLQSGGPKSERTLNGPDWLHHPCHLGGLEGFIAKDKIKSGPKISRLATSPLPSRGSPLLQTGSPNQKWPTCVRIGYITPAVCGTLKQKSRGQHQKWPKCVRNGCITRAL